MDPTGEHVSRINFIPCLKWVKKGVAKARPAKVQLTKEELADIINQTKSQLRITEDSDDENPIPSNNAPNADEFNLENYDNENESVSQSLGIGNIAELAAGVDDSDDSEEEDDIIKKGDNLILVGRVEGDASVLEVHVYNESEESLYVHHDFLLPAFPLCLEWLDYEPGHVPGNYCAIASMSPVIQIWDLDIMNCLEPAYKLGRRASQKKGRTQIGHTDAVLDLAWNKNFHHILASGSVDKSIILWDLDEGAPASTINAFTDKVQCLKWHQLEAQTLLAGSCDSTVKVFDCRNSDTHQTWQLTGEAERVIWNPLQPYSFFAATSIGTVQYFDCRQGEVWTLQAHEKEVTGIAVSGQCPGLLVTASMDNTLKVWDFQETGVPVLVQEKDFKMGVMHCLELCPDLPFVIAAGGDNKSNNLTVFDLQNLDVVKHVFGSRQLVQLVSEESSS